METPTGTNGARGLPHPAAARNDPFSLGSCLEPGIKVRLEPGQKPFRVCAASWPVEPGLMGSLVPVRKWTGTKPPRAFGRKPYFLLVSRDGEPNNNAAIAKTQQHGLCPAVSTSGCEGEVAADGTYGGAASVTLALERSGGLLLILIENFTSP